MKFVDLSRQWSPLVPQILYEIEEVARSASFIGGEKVQRAEKAIAEYIGRTNPTEAILCSSGTAALQLILMGLGIGPGDIVIIPGSTFIATYFAVQHVGAETVLADICEDDYCIDPLDIRNILGYIPPGKVKAIIPVHLYGQTAKMQALKEIADEYGIYLIEDACQAFGAQYRGIQAGNLGVAAAFSFYPAKNLGTWGEGGAVVTQDRALADKIRAILDQGQVGKYNHMYLGHNFRLSSILSIPIYHGIKRIDEWNQSRRRAARLYDEHLGEEGTPKELPGNHHIYHLYEYRVPLGPGLRDDLKKTLESRRIPSALHYPTPLESQPAYHSSFHPRRLETVNMTCDHLLSLPMHPFLGPDDIREVASTVLEWRESVQKKGETDA